MESGLNDVRLSEISVRPELVEGLYVSCWWFDRLTTNGKSNSIESGLIFDSNKLQSLWFAEPALSNRPANYLYLFVQHLFLHVIYPLFGDFFEFCEHLRFADISLGSVYERALYSQDVAL
jgi:hypothetical protein